MKRKRFLLTMLFSAIGAFLGGSNLWAQWTSKTNLISDPSFENTNASVDLSSNPNFQSTNEANFGSWRITASALSQNQGQYAQYGVANSSTKILGIGGRIDPESTTDFTTTFKPASDSGSKYFYTRNNWNPNATFTLSQTVTDDLPAGTYRLTCKAATFASLNSQFYLTLAEGNGTGVSSHYDTAAPEWTGWSVILTKAEANTSLTISATMIPGGGNSGQNYCMLLDDFQLEYLAPVSVSTVLTQLPSDLNDYFYVIRDFNSGLTLELGRDEQQVSEYRTLWYRANVDPLTDMTHLSLMTMVQDNNYQVVTCAGWPDYMLQTERDASWHYRTHDNGGNGGLYWGRMKFEYENGGWTVQNGVYPDNGYWGTWRDGSGGNAVAGDEIAANKSTTDRSIFEISAIKRGQYLQQVLTKNFYNKENISYVITNRNAERMSTAGWTLSAANAFNSQNDANLTNKNGTYYFEHREESGNISNRSIHQTLTDMKEGYYTIEVATNVTAAGAFLYANNEQVELNTNTDGVASVKVHVDANGTLDYGVKLEGYKSNWVAFDNFKMYYSSEADDPLIADGTYYLYSQYNDNSTDKNRFLARKSTNNENRAVVDQYGIPIKIINQGNNTVMMQFADVSTGYLGNTYFLNTDVVSVANPDPNYLVPNKFKVIASTVTGVEGYHFETQEAYVQNNHKYMYVWLNNNEPNNYYRVAGNSATNINDNYTRTVWKLLTPEERNAIINNYPQDNVDAVIDEAKSTYRALQSAVVTASQFSYWLNANYTATDKTDKINTPKFDEGKIGGWTFSQSVSQDGSTNPKFGSGLAELYKTCGTWSQTITGLDNGIYRLTVNAFERHGTPSQETLAKILYGNIGSAYLKANDQQIHLASWNEAFTNTTDPNTLAEAKAKFEADNYVNEVFVYVSDGTLTINVSMPGYVDQCWLPMNNFTLTYYSPTQKTIAQPTGERYLRNVATGQYITFDGYWGTYYSMSDVGKRLTLEASSDGTTLMHTTYLSNTDDMTSSHDTENYFYSYPGNIEHAFSNGNSTEGGEKWVFYETNTAGVYSIMNYMTGYYLSGSNGNDTNSLGWGGLMKATDNDADTKWELVTKKQLTTALNASGATYPQDASFLIDEPDFIIGYNNVYKEFYSWKVMGNDQYKYSDWTDKNIISFYSQNNGVSTGNVAYAFSVASDYPDILQTIENIPNGLYVVECQAMFRDGTEGPKSDDPSTSASSSSRRHDDRLADGTYVNRAFLYANDDMKPSEEANQDARVMRDRYWIYDNAQMVPVNAAPAGLFEINNRKSHLKPQLLDEFRDGHYTVQLPVYVSTGKLTIGVLQQIGINENLLAFDRFRLKYYGTAYTGDEVKNIALGNLNRLRGYYDSGKQSKAITDTEKDSLLTAITAIASASDYNTNANTVTKYNKAAQEYGETSINWYIFNVLKTDYDRGDYRTVANGQERKKTTNIRYPYVDEASKKEVVKYFGAGTDTNNGVSYDTNTTYQADTKIDGRTDQDATLENLKAAISALRTYVESNAEVRYLEDEQVKGGFLANTEEARRISREARMALRSGRKENIVTEEGVRRRSYEINPVMFTNDGASVTAPEINMIMTNARCWAPRDAYHHRYFDYTNYYGQGPHTNEIQIEGLTTGKYLVTISESHNNELKSVKFNAWVGDNHIVEDEQLFHQDESVWQIYTHSWQDISCVIDITDQFEPVKLQFKGGGSDVGAEKNATMNITNLRIYRMEDLQTLFLDEDATILAKNGMALEDNGVAYQGYHNVKTLLRRTMAKDQWNTLVLPVNLTKQQVIAAFGEGTILATMDGFSTDYGNPDNCIHFTTDDLSTKADDDPAIEEGKVYLIKPTADPAVSSEEQVYFKNSYEHRNAYEPVDGPIYYLDYVDYHVTEGESNPEEGDKVAHTAPSTTQNPIIDAAGQQAGKLSLQMRGTYGKTAVPVNATENGGTNYIYAFQQQSDDNVYLVELDPKYGESRQFKGYRGWAVANYKESAPVRQSYLVLLDEGDDQLTVIRGIDSEEGYSEVKIPRQGIYDLQGRSIDRKEFYSGSYPQGVYIVDGKKVVRK